MNTFIVDTTSQTLYGTSGDDTFNGGAGSDTLLGHAGNDIFNVTSKSGSFTDTIYGGAGTDSLVVSYTGITSMDNFTIGYNSSTSTFTFTDPSGGVINARDIETFSFGGKSYIHYTGDGGTDINRNVKGFWSESENLLMLYGGASSFLRDFDQANKTLYGHSKNEDLTIKGNSETNYMNLGTIGSATDSDDYSGTLTLKMGGGSEGLAMYQPSGSSSDSTNHSIDLGAGDDYYYTASGAQSLAVSKLDGGAGIDKLYFDGTNTVALTLTTGNAINFENITGGGGDDNISGDNNANVLEGKNGTDNISGYGGNDILGGHDSSVSSESGNDLLYGGAGNDILYGTAGENKLDGGTGQDNMTGGNGADTFIIRSGDGGSALTDADIIMDYQDGTDVIGLDGGLSFDDLTIAQGSGSNSSHTTIRITSSGEYLAIVKNAFAGNVNILDFSSTSTSAQTLNGTSGNDSKAGGAGVDTFNGGAGSDTLLGHAGNDIFNVTSKSGSFTDTIYGGAGTDSLVVSYTGITSMDNFTIGYNSSTSTFTFTDPSGGVINARDIETFSFGGKSYIHYTGDGGTDINRNVKGFWSESENLLMLYGGASSFLRDFDQANKTLYGHSKNEDLTIKGNSETNYMNLGTIGSATDSDDYSGTLTLKMGGGSEGLAMYQPSGSSSDSTNHSIDLGAGDDYYYTASGAQSLAVSKLDGGAGIDKLYFDGTNTVALTLTTGNAINFENITGGGGDDNISGDNNANVLEGKNGTDNISGYGGNDILGGHDSSVSSESGNDLLYGGAGNDILYGTAGENKLDGGTGQDNMTGGNGADTFIIRSGDGGSALTDADIIMDYQDGTDVIGLDGGLSFDDLTIAQGSGSNSSHTTIRITSSGEYLSILQNVSASNISEADFSIMN